jgi:phytoene synthase
VPPGSVRYWSWLFAAGEAREPLLGIYALSAEWRALLDPSTDAAVAQAKLVWWREEIRRLVVGSPLHPITRHIAALPHAQSADLARLDLVVEAAAAEVAGVPLERREELDAHADALYGIPLRLAATLGEPRSDSAGVRASIAALAAAEYLARALHGYRREAQSGRVAFPVDELLAAGIDNDDLMTVPPPPRMASYLDRLRDTATGYFSTAAGALAPAERPAMRHLAVLARLGLRHMLAQRSPTSADFRFVDLYNAWNAAHRAAAGR